MRKLTSYIIALTLLTAVFSCAKMGSPDGGWFDETPPRILGSTPTDKGTGVKTKKINIYFDEFIKIDNPTEKVVVSPPQLEAPEIKGAGKRISIELKDSLKENTTYTIDFSDAISDNNEGNPLGNYTYSFSTGSEIDTMEVSGHVLNAENLEPVKGILVGLYDDLADSAFTTKPMLRVARTDSRGIFIIKGIKPGKYRIYALQDADGDYKFSQKSEMVAFYDGEIKPEFKPDVRQDTIWRDSLHIDSIVRVKYTHFLPDNITLRAFTEVQTDRYLIKTERPKAEFFSLYFSYGNEELPRIKGLNFDERDAFITETTAKHDTLTYWLRDTTLVNQDTLRMELRYLATDTLGALQEQCDTLEMLSKEPYAKRMKQRAKDFEKWQKEQEKAKKDGKPYQEEMPAEPLAPVYKVAQVLEPDRNPQIFIPSPLAQCDTAKIHLYAKHDSLWYRAQYLFQQDTTVTARCYKVMAEWRPGTEYSFEVDSAAFTDIYGRVSEAYKCGFKVGNTDDYGSLFMTLTGMADTTVVAQLLDSQDRVVRETQTSGGTAEFYYLKPGTYYLRMFIDSNRNGVWDTGLYAGRQQAETVYYYSEKIECKAKWDITQTWNPRQKAIEQQKPSEITKQKPEKQKTVKNQNAERARKLGIQYIPKL